MNFNQFPISIVVFILLQFISMNARSQKLELLSKLPSIINESSGLETTGKNQIWTFNDAGGKPELYLIDRRGNLLKTLAIVNVKNRDWEDISKDFGDYWVTGAAISPSGDKVCLLNDKKLWVFYNFEKDQFLNGDFLEIDLGKKTQKEAVCFVSNNLLYISDEHWQNSNEGGNLYKLKLDNKFKKHENKN